MMTHYEEKNDHCEFFKQMYLTLVLQLAVLLYSRGILPELWVNRE